VLARVLSRPTAAVPQLPVDAEGLVGRAPAMQEIFRQVALAASGDVHALLIGESGTGKELLARAIHRYSARSAEPFAALSVAGLDAAQADAALFGPPGADPASAAGTLHMAQAGTVYLEDVDQLPLATQAKLLRALDHGELQSTAREQLEPRLFRLICAARHDLLPLVRGEMFRQDLYLRMSGVLMQVPPLRERREDVPLLIEYFAARMRQGSQAAPRISREALLAASQRNWWGNLHELRKAVEQACLQAGEGFVLAEHWPPEFPQLAAAQHAPASISAEVRKWIVEWTAERIRNHPDSTLLYDDFLALVEPPFLEATLRRNKNQCATAARALGMHRMTLRKKMDQYGLTDEET
jgi:two-component system nitrogen regulation response regulator GlnG